MPRPLRSRVASAPAAAAATVESSSSSSDPPPTSKPAAHLRGGGGPPSDSTDIYDISDQEKEKIAARTKSAAVRSRASARQAKALDESKQRRDAALRRLDDLLSTSTAASERGSRAEKGSSPAVERGRRQSSLVATRRRRGTAPDASGLDVMDDDDDMFGNLDLEADIDSSEDEGTGMGTGHRSADTSSFNVALFKRGRSRQSSIVGRDDAPIRPSSRGPNTPGLSSTFNLGAFKRRAREPSILGTGRKPRIEEPEPEPESAREDGDDEEEENDLRPVTAMAAAPAIEPDHGQDWEPDAAAVGSGPPLARRRTRGSAASTAARESLPPLQTDATRSRKRKSTDAQEGPSKRTALPSSDDVQPSIEGGDDDQDLSLPRLSTPIQRRRQTSVDLVIDPDDEILAPPMSSGSSDSSPPLWLSTRDLTRKPVGGRAASRSRKTPAPGGGDNGDASDISSPPSLTHSPNYPTAREQAKAGVRARRRSSPRLTTAQLTSMLPQRRHRARDGDDDDNPWDLDSDGNDEDELSRRPARRGPAARRQEQQQQQMARVARQRHAAGAAGAQSSTAAGNKRTARRTYGSRGFDNNNNSDKENQAAAAGGEEEDNSIEVATEDFDEDASDVLPDDTFDASVEKPGGGVQTDELRRAAEKFKEVDKWALSFEEVSSPMSADAR